MYDDNNEQNNGVVKETAKEFAKQTANEAKREAKKQIGDMLKKALLTLVKSPHFWIAVGIIVAVVIILAGIHYVVQKAENNEYAAARERLTTENGFFSIGKTIFNNRYYEYEVTDDEIALMDEVLEALDCNKDNFNNFEKYVLLHIANIRRNADESFVMDKDLSKYSEKELHMFPLFVKAELKSLYPNLDPHTIIDENNGKFQGNVIISRGRNSITI